MKRRSFLARAAGCLTAAAVLPVSESRASDSVTLQMPAAPYEDPNDFLYRGWRVRWAGWRSPVNQILQFGIWVAHREGIWRTNTTGMTDRQVEELHRIFYDGYYSTTLGVCEPYKDLQALDCSLVRNRGGVVLQGWSSHKEKEAAKARAKANLLDALLKF